MQTAHMNLRQRRRHRDTGQYALMDCVAEVPLPDAVGLAQRPTARGQMQCSCMRFVTAIVRAPPPRAELGAESAATPPTQLSGRCDADAGRPRRHDPLLRMQPRQQCHCR
jgi:hypothetical protein